MKFFILFTLLFSFVSQAQIIDAHLQAIILHKDYIKVSELMKRAVDLTGKERIAVLGESYKIGTGPVYEFYIPVEAVKVPLSEMKPLFVGTIVAEMEMGANSPLPTVRSLGFARAIPGGITGFLPSSTMVCHSKGMVDNGFEVIITLNEPTESSPLIQIREMRAYRTEPVEFKVIVVEKNNQLIYHHDDFELRFNVNSANELRPGPVLFIGKVFGKDINETLACE